MLFFVIAKGPCWFNVFLKEVFDEIYPYLFQEDSEIRPINNIFELWHASIGPEQYYENFIMRMLLKAKDKIPHEGEPFTRLQLAFDTLQMPITYVKERGIGFHLANFQFRLVI